jgi:hypothetical protein
VGKRKKVFEEGVKEETEQLLRESVEAALVAKNEARLAEGKRRVGVLKWEERYPIESGVRERQAGKRFDTPKPVFIENQKYTKMKAQKLDLRELEQEVEKLEK